MSTLLFKVRYRVHVARRRKSFAADPIRSGDIVFVGDSITHTGSWEDWFPEQPVRNRGISGDKTAGVLKRLDDVLADPAAIFLMIGTNDVGDGRPTAFTLGLITQVVATIRDRCPSTRVIVQSVLPRSLPFASAVAELNAGLETVATTRDADYLDCFASFADERGAIRPEFSADELHLTPAGYDVWRGLLEPLMEELRS